VKEIRLHGRGGQGVVTAAQLLAHAAFADGKFSQAFPTFGSERMGAPVAAFVRIDKEKIRLRSEIYEPDIVIVQDPTLIGVIDTWSGLKKGGLIIVNTKKEPEELGIDKSFRVRTIPATSIALEIFKRPIPNTVILGAFAGITEEISFEAVKKAIQSRFEDRIAELNIQAAEKAYKMVKGSLTG
jgi:pyruvate ferredoxin oxidoreductase gamma subunit